MQFRAYIFLILGIILTSGLFVFSGKFINIFQDKNLALLAEIPLNNYNIVSFEKDTAQENKPKKVTSKKSEKEIVNKSQPIENSKPPENKAIINSRENIPANNNSLAPTVPQNQNSPTPLLSNALTYIQPSIASPENTPSNTSTSNQEATSSNYSVNDSNPPPPSPISNVSHVLISEIQLTGGSGKTTNDFIELWNPTDSDIDISNWKLRKRTQSGSESSMGVFADGSIIKSHGFFLWANSNDGFSSSIGADIEYSSYSIADNSSIALQDKDENIIDAVAWGNDLTNPFGETSSISIILEANQSYERKSWTDSGCASSSGAYELKGNGCDNNSNNQDFELRTVSNPQNSKSSKEG
ncbi:MAG: lamin tail domain-containing protein [Candidatus Pacebacteria bacterium]|nr:lamin tail domain-containing protein [Candidatus Paceibacterota bacterium]